jgi:hypothetical protein
LSLSEIVAGMPTGPDYPRIHRGDLSRLERGRLLPPDEWVPLLEAAYGAPQSSWYTPPPGTVAGVAIERDESRPPSSEVKGGRGHS